MQVTPSNEASIDQSPCFLLMRFLEAGNFSSILVGLIGRFTRLPPQFGHTWFKTDFAHSMQKVHSKVQMTASCDDGGRSLSQFSQLGRRSSMVLLCLVSPDYAPAGRLFQT